MIVPRGRTEDGPRPPPDGPGRAGGLFGAAFAFGVALTAIGLEAPGLVLGSTALVLLLAAVPPRGMRRFSAAAWRTALTIGGGMALGAIAWRVLSLAV